mmetsp:Transcript_68556/g.203982  ORF Transcript_68556/g.203982 Transcript_68556/m.203982 type:complete len:104 (+) Transcript_68556:98-409(+)
MQSGRRRAMPDVDDFEVCSSTDDDAPFGDAGQSPGAIGQGSHGAEGCDGGEPSRRGSGSPSTSRSVLSAPEGRSPKKAIDWRRYEIHYFGLPPAGRDRAVGAA